MEYYLTQLRHQQDGGGPWSCLNKVMGRFPLLPRGDLTFFEVQMGDKVGEVWGSRRSRGRGN